MRRILSSLWIGHVGDVWNLHSIHDAEIEALVDLAINEPIPTLTRELIYCRFPLVDGEGNSPMLLGLAIQTTLQLLQTKTPTLVYCSGGMSRSVGIVAAALGLHEKIDFDNALSVVAQTGPADVSATLYAELRYLLENRL